MASAIDFLQNNVSLKCPEVESAIIYSCVEPSFFSALRNMTALTGTIENTDINTSKMHSAMSKMIEILFRGEVTDRMHSKRTGKLLSESSVLGCHAYPEGASSNIRTI